MHIINIWPKFIQFDRSQKKVWDFYLTAILTQLQLEKSLDSTISRTLMSRSFIISSEPKTSVKLGPSISQQEFSEIFRFFMRFNLIRLANLKSAMKIWILPSCLFTTFVFVLEKMLWKQLSLLLQGSSYLVLPLTHLFIKSTSQH